MTSNFRLSAETGLAALLSAMAGFFVSKLGLFELSSANDGLATIGFIIAYMALFLGPALFFQFRRVMTKDDRWRIYLLGSGLVVAALVVLSQTISLYWGAENGFGGNFIETYAIPILVLPMIWWLVHVYDEFEEAAAKRK